MKLNLRGSTITAVAIACGLIVLLGYFLEIPLLVTLREIFLRWSIILTTVALLVGVVNLARVNWRKVRTGQKDAAYSMVLLVFLALSIIILVSFGPTSSQATWIYNYVQIPVEASLMAILAVVLIYSAARIFTRRMNLFSFVFLGTVLIVLLGTVSIPGFGDVFAGLRAWIVQVLATAGARGILLGVALGTVATGLRILMGSDRPYGSS